MRVIRFWLTGLALLAAVLLAGCGEMGVEAQPPTAAPATATMTPSATVVSPARVATDTTLVLTRSTTTVAAPALPPLPPQFWRGGEPTAVVLAQSLNVRTGPGAAYPVVAVLEQGTAVQTLAISSDRSWVQVALERGTGWVSAQYVRLEQAATLAVVTDIPPPPPSPTPPPAPTAHPTPAALPAPVCDTVPLRGFGVVWAEHPEIQPLLGCPNYQQTERGTQAAAQPFEYGLMIWVGDDGAYQPTDPTFVLFDAGDWAFFPEIGTATIEETPPPGLYPPEDVFARVWRDGTGAQVRQRLGWATAPLTRGPGAIQAFWNGRMIWFGPTDTIYVLIERWTESGRQRFWYRFEDTFEG